MTEQFMSVDEIRKLAVDCLTGHGCNQDNAHAVASTLAAAERDGCQSHGLMRLPGYVATLKSGKDARNRRNGTD